MLKIDKSYMGNGWIGIFSDDEFGHLEESRSFKDIKSLQIYINTLQNELNKYKNRHKTNQKKGGLIENG